MRVLALDLSTSTGISYFESGQLVDYFVIKNKVEGNYKSDDYPFNYIDMAERLALMVCAHMVDNVFDYVVIEETNKSKNRYSQKQLEFIHYAVVIAIRNLTASPKIIYMDTSAWRGVLGISLNPDQRVSNKARTQERDAKRVDISRGVYSKHSHQIEKEVEGLGKRDTNKIIKKWDKEIDKLVSIKMRSHRSSIKVVDTKSLAVEYVNENFNLKLKKSQNDIADAICLGWAFISNDYSATHKK